MNQDNKPTILILCGGYGLVSFAATQAEYNVIGCVDNAEMPERSYAANFPDTPFLRKSIREISTADICLYFKILPGTLDVVQISTPCTGLSSTGEFVPTDADNELFCIGMFHAFQLRPRVLLFENVLGMTWDRMKSTFNIYASFFRKMEGEYDIKGMEMYSDNYGDPQSRGRAFIQCVKHDDGVARWPLPLPTNRRKGISSVLPDIDYLVNRNFGERTYEHDEPAPTITANANVIVGTKDGKERAATPRELARLMSLPDSFVLVGNENQQVRGVGNGVPVEIMKALLLTIKHDVLKYEKPANYSWTSVPTDIVGKKGYVLYEGPSRINGDNIVAIITNNSENRKTGDMAQLWILPADVKPTDAVKNGKDESVCGDCKLRQYNRGACYVQIGEGPRSVWAAWKKSNTYSSLPLEEYHIYKDIPIRFGAYGDPAAIPSEIISTLKRFASNTTGYTHQWNKEHAASLRDHCMASVDNEEEYKQAVTAGWRTFRILSEGAALMENEILCVNITNGTLCSDCSLCTGASKQAKNIAIPVHGSRKNRFKRHTPVSVKTQELKGVAADTQVAKISDDWSDEVITGSPKIISSKMLLSMNFNVLEFDDKFLEFLGRPSANFNMVVHGMAGQGKSTFAVQFAKYLAKNFGKVLYVSGEEGFNSTLRDKFKVADAMMEGMFIADLHKYEELVTEIIPDAYDFIFIDSLDTMKIKPRDMKELRLRHPESAFITISQNTKAGQIRGSYELVHDADIAIKVVNGVAVTEKNRFKQMNVSYTVFS